MKIGFVLDDGLDRGDGVQQYILTLGEWMAAQGHEVHYLVGQTRRTDISNVHSLSRNISVHFNGNQMSMPLSSSRRKVRRLLKQEQFDVLHVQMPYSPLMAAKVIRLAPPGTRLVGTFHIMPYGRLQDLGAKLLAWWTRRTTARLHQVWSVSKPAQTFAASLGIKSSILPNVVNIKAFAVKPERRKDFTIVFLGRLVERKGASELLAAFSLLSKELPSARLIIGGAGVQAEQLLAWSKQHSLRHVTFKGFVRESQKAAFLAQADVAVFPSLGGESFGIVLLEAMAAGAGVVIGGQNPGYASVLQPTPEALIDPRNTTGFATMLLRLHDDKPLVERLHKAQQELVKQYDVAIVGEKLLSYYKG